MSKKQVIKVVAEPEVLTAEKAKARVANDGVQQTRGNQKYLDNLKRIKSQVFNKKNK